MSRTRMITLAVSLIVFAIVLSLQTPRETDFPKFVNIPEGTTLHEAGSILKQQRIIVSEFLFKAFAVVTGGAQGVKAGDYLFAKPPRLFVTSWRITHASFGIDPVRVLIPEGTAVHEMKDIFTEALPSFDASLFETLAESREGYLFPDTYFFLPNIAPKTVIEAMSQNFNEKIGTLQTAIEASGRTVSDVVIMASILEEEARSFEDKQIVAGILWKRLDNDMALQVDAPFVYLLGKGSADLTLDDLKTDSPYNTYLYRGLTPTPISNPGLESLRAAVEPIASEHLFYLSDADGVMHYAEDFEQHKRNKELYLR